MDGVAHAEGVDAVAGRYHEQLGFGCVPKRPRARCAKVLATLTLGQSGTSVFCQETRESFFEGFKDMGTPFSV